MLKLGILGGGQLGRMLLQKAYDYPIKTLVLDKSNDMPAAPLTDTFVIGDFNKEADVLAFGRRCDVVTIEIEHVHVGALYQLQKEGIKVFPQPEIIEMVQDKGLQKDFYARHGFPTAPYVLVEQKADLAVHQDLFPVFQKKRKGGYDGKGVVALNGKNEDKAFDAPSVLEQKADLAKELSIIVARNEAGQVETFPLVELVYHPEANMVDYLMAPAEIEEKVAVEAKAQAEALVEKLDLVGILAIELFLNKDGSLWINEIAPRPHNSGHHTIEANLTSQYEQHLRAILGYPLGKTTTLSPAAMVNLVGAEGHTGDAHYQGLAECMALDGCKVHVYGKKTTKPFRKMGHVSLLGQQRAEVIQKVAKVKQGLQVVAKNQK